MGKVLNISDIISNKIDVKILTLFGEEDYLLDEDFKTLIKNKIVSELDEFNFETVDCEKIDLSSFMSKLNTIPMMGDSRFIVAQNFEHYFKGNSKSKKDKDIFNELSNYLKKPSPSTFLLIKGVEELNNNSKTKGTKLKFPYDILINDYHWIEYIKIDSFKLIPWVKDRFKISNKEISTEAIELILSSAPEDLRSVNAEVDKVLSFAKDISKINVEIIEKVVGVSRENNNYELQRMVGERNLEKALLVAERLLKYKKEEILIVNILFRYFLSLWKLIEERSKNLNSYDLSKNIGIYYKNLPDYQKSLSLYSLDKINENFTYLCEADEKLKSSSGSGLLIIQELIIKMVE